MRKISTEARTHEKLKVLEMLKFPNDRTPKVSDASGIYEEPWAYKKATKKWVINKSMPNPMA